MSRCILVVEDQADIRELVRMTLEFQGMVVREAAHGAAGLESARAERPDLILLDVMMPGMGGLAMCRELSQDADLCRVPVVMLSARGTAEDVAAGLSAGARAYLVKPFSPMALLNLTSRLLAGH